MVFRLFYCKSFRFELYLERDMKNLCELVTGNGYRKLIQAILDGGDISCPDARGISPLVWVVVRGHLPAVQVLTVLGANPNAYVDISLQFLQENACYFLRSELDRMRVFDNPRDWSQRVRCTALHLAVLRGHAEMVAQLVYCGGDPELEMESELPLLRGNCWALAEDFCFVSQDECRDALQAGAVKLSKAGFAAFLYKKGIDNMQTIDAYVSHVNNLGTTVASSLKVYGELACASLAAAVREACCSPLFVEKNVKYKGACLAAVNKYLEYVESCRKCQVVPYLKK